jgi:hypothetical protein
MSLYETAATGDQLATLKELRQVIAREISNTESARDVAPLARQLVEVMDKIARLEQQAAAKTGTAKDELAKKREERAKAVRVSRANTARKTQRQAQS